MSNLYDLKGVILPLVLQIIKDLSLFFVTLECIFSDISERNYDYSDTRDSADLKWGNI